MGTISDYTIYCTEEQTNKALELGATLKPYNAKGYVESGCAEIPTAEQMIGFLEETLKEVSVRQSIIGSWFYELYINPYELIEKNCGYISRREATLAAIDAALDYLINNK